MVDDRENLTKEEQLIRDMFVSFVDLWILSLKKEHETSNHPLNECIQRSVNQYKASLSAHIKASADIAEIANLTLAQMLELVQADLLDKLGTMYEKLAACQSLIDESAVKH